MLLTHQVETIDTVRKGYLGNPDKRLGFEAFFICADGAPVGYASFFMNPSHKLSSEQVVWPSIAIGEPLYRRRGLVREMGIEISRRSRKYGATHFEAGIFDSNQAMASWLVKYGFSPIGEMLVGPEKIPSTHYCRPLFERP